MHAVCVTNIFINNIDNGVQCTLSKLQMTPRYLSAIADMVEGRDAIHRDSKRWDQMNLMKFSNAKYKVLHLIQGNPKHHYRLRNEQISGVTPNR